MTRRQRYTRKNFVYPSAFDHLLSMTGTPTWRAAAMLGRTTRTVTDWRNGRRPVPRWAFELIEFQVWQRVDTFRAHAAVWARPNDIDLRPCFGERSANDPPSLLWLCHGNPPLGNTGGNPKNSSLLGKKGHFMADTPNPICNSPRHSGIQRSGAPALALLCMDNNGRQGGARPGASRWQLASGCADASQGGRPQRGRTPWHRAPQAPFLQAHGLPHGTGAALRACREARAAGRAGSPKGVSRRAEAQQLMTMERAKKKPRAVAAAGARPEGAR